LSEVAIFDWTKGPNLNLSGKRTCRKPNMELPECNSDPLQLCRRHGKNKEIKECVIDQSTVLAGDEQEAGISKGTLKSKRRDEL